MNDRESPRTEAGTWLKVSGLTPQKDVFEEVLHLVPDHEANRVEHDIAVGSLLGQALSGIKVGEQVVLDTADGPMKLMVLRLGSCREEVL